jgi:hypothetical protein
VQSFQPEQDVVATDASVNALFVIVPAFPGECRFRSLFLRDMVLLRGQALSPFGIGFYHFSGDYVSFLFLLNKV